MRSRAHLSGHPIHPMLVPFPFAFMIGAAAAEIAALALSIESLATVAGWLIAAGVVSALLAAVPGLIDYLSSIPPESTGKTRGTRHALLMVGATALFAVAFFVRGGIDGRGDVVSIVLELAGVAALAIGGWMGGTLLVRNQISVDHRYAAAGKWKEESIERSASGGTVVVGRDELRQDQMKLVRLSGRRIGVGRTEQGHVAFDDRCPHRGGSLADGVLICGTVQCPWHGSQFDVHSGAVKAGPAKEGIEVWKVDEEGRIDVR